MEKKRRGREEGGFKDEANYENSMKQKKSKFQIAYEGEIKVYYNKYMS